MPRTPRTIATGDDEVTWIALFDMEDAAGHVYPQVVRFTEQPTDPELMQLIRDATGPVEMGQGYTRTNQVQTMRVGVYESGRYLSVNKK